MSERSPRRLVAALTSGLLAVLIVGLAGCSGAGDSSSPVPAPTPTFANADDWNAAFNECLVDNGVDLDSDGVPRANGPDAETILGDAITACYTALGPEPGGGLAISPEEAYEGWMEVVTCLRGKGYTVPDPVQQDGVWAWTQPAEVTDAAFSECADGGDEESK